MIFSTKNFNLLLEFFVFISVFAKYFFEDKFFSIVLT